MLAKTLLRLTFWCALSLAPAVARAAPVPAEVFFKDPDIVEALLSPSGRKLAITTSLGADRVGLAMLDLAPGGAVTRIVQFTDGDVHGVHWVNDERLVFSVLDFSEGSGKPSGAPGLYAVNVDGSKLLPLVRRRGRPFVTSGGVDKVLDWNHRLLKVPAPLPDQPNEEVLVAEFSTDEPYTQHPLWLNVRSGRTRDAEFHAPPKPVGWFTDSRGDARVVLTRDKGRQAAFWRAPGSKDWQKLYESGLLDAPFQINSVDDAGHLFVTRSEGPEGFSALTRYSFDTMAPEPKPWVVTPGFDFSGTVITDAGDGRAKGVRLRVDGETTVWFDAAMKALQAQVDQRLPGRSNRITCRRCGQPDMVALVHSSSDHHPGQIWLYQAEPGAKETAWRSIGPVRTGLKPEQMAGVDFQRIKARDGRDLPVWITRPDRTDGPLPTVVLVHGGPWVRGGIWGWHPDAQFLASRGYLVIEPEFRGSLGYGEQHFRAGWKQWGQAMQDDVADALLWARKLGLASDKACIAGASYGGYSTLMGLVRHPELYRCGVAWLAVTDLELLVQGSWWVNDDSDMLRKYGMPDLIGDPKLDAARIAANSPVKQAARIKSPVLLAFGEADIRVPLTHGKRMRDALTDAGNPPEWVSYPGEGHGFAVLKNRLDFAQRMETFLAKHLLGRP